VAALDRLEIRKAALRLEVPGDDGGQVHTCDLRAVLDGSDRASFRISKLGDVALWIGVVPDACWIFDLISEPTTLTVSRPRDGGLFSLLRVQRFRMLMGLDPWPVESSATVEKGEVVVRGATEGGRFEARLSVDDLRPMFVSIHLPEEDLVLEATHHWQAGTCSVRGAAGARPLARSVDLQSSSGEFCRIGLDTGRLSPRVITPSELAEPPLSAFFNLEKLKVALKPDEVK